jgi:hypothetical protein
MWNRYLARFPNRDRLSVLIGVILLGLAITQFIQLPSRHIGADVFGSPLGLEISGYWMIVSVLIVLASAGTDTLMRAHPQFAHTQQGAVFITWILPALTVLVAAYILSAVPGGLLWLAGLGLTGVAFGAVVITEYLVVGDSQPAGSRPRLVLNIVSYILILILYTAIYQARARSLITVTATLALSGLVALDLLWVARAGLGRTALLAILVGLILGECSWALNYWRASTWMGSLVLLITFYTLSGLAAQFLLGKLSRFVLLEYIAVIIAGAGLLIAFHP